MRPLARGQHQAARRAVAGLSRGQVAHGRGGQPAHHRGQVPGRCRAAARSTVRPGRHGPGAGRAHDSRAGATLVSRGKAECAERLAATLIDPRGDATPLVFAHADAANSAPRARCSTLASRPSRHPRYRSGFREVSLDQLRLHPSGRSITAKAWCRSRPTMAWRSRSTDADARASDRRAPSGRRPLEHVEGVKSVRLTSA